MNEDTLNASGRSYVPAGTLYAWDEAKRLANIEKHHIDFLDAAELFEGEYLDRPAREVDGEQRRAATGLVEGRFITVIYVIRGEEIRLISARRARDNERRGYEALHDRGTPGSASP